MILIMKNKNKIMFISNKLRFKSLAYIKLDSFFYKRFSLLNFSIIEGIKYFYNLRPLLNKYFNLFFSYN